MRNANRWSRHLKKGLIYLCSTLILFSVIYNIYDNHRFRLVAQEITIDRLPESFDGFRILQISDLHGRYFGEDQSRLVEYINSLDYDMIALTGDMDESDAKDGTLAHSQAILDLLEGIEHRKPMFWIDGNVGPYAVETIDGAGTGNLTPIGKILEEKGCQMLLLPVPLQRGDDRIWITPEMSEMLFDAYYRSRFDQNESGISDADTAQLRSFYETAYGQFLSIRDNGEVKIMLMHAPYQINLTEDEIAPLGNLDYDLILAGHYHGGQFRLPLIGALYIPSPTTGLFNRGIFPDQSAVRGLSQYGDTPQYISAGLGSTGHIPLLNFRLFNTPEINLIILQRP